MRRIFNRVVYIAALLALFAYPGHEMLMNVIDSVAAQTQIISGLIYTSPIAVPGSFAYNGGPQVSAVKANGGTATCTGGGTITVANTNVTANSIVLMTLKTVGGTVAQPFVATITPATGFTFTCGGSDTSVYNYIVLG